jgi:hypothetical protein
MILRKKTAIALLLMLAASLLSVAFGAGLAHADDKDPQPGQPLATHQPRPHGDESVGKSEHDQLREKYGDKDIDQVFLPPLVVTDPAATGSISGNVTGAGKGPAKPIGQAPVENLVDATNVDPAANSPIDLKNIRANGESPAQSFFEIATVALGAMAAGSIALGAMAIRRAVKIRKTPNADFIYE